MKKQNNFFKLFGTKWKTVQNKTNYIQYNSFQEESHIKNTVIRTNTKDIIVYE